MKPGDFRPFRRPPPRRKSRLRGLRAEPSRCETRPRLGRLPPRGTPRRSAACLGQLDGRLTDGQLQSSPRSLLRPALVRPARGRHLGLQRHGKPPRAPARRSDPDEDRARRPRPAAARARRRRRTSRRAGGPGGRAGSAGGTRPRNAGEGDGGRAGSNLQRGRSRARRRRRRRRRRQVGRSTSWTGRARSAG